MWGGGRGRRGGAWRGYGGDGVRRMEDRGGGKAGIFFFFGGEGVRADTMSTFMRSGGVGQLEADVND